MPLTERFRRRLDSWEWWIGAAYFVLAAVITALFFINQKTSANIRRTAADEASHASEIVANAEGQYVACIKSIPELSKINRFIHGVQDLHLAQEENALNTLEATDRHDPLYPVRVASYERFKHAADQVSGVSFTVPTKKTCRELRSRLLNQK